MKLVLFILLLVIPCGTLHAEIALPCLFQDHMVLQGSTSIPVWGRADPDETITVRLGDKIAETHADAAGRWHVALDLHDQAGGPFELVAEGKNRVVLSDVLIGEVWVASGQSNMEFSLKDSENGKEEIARSANSQLRQFKVLKRGSMSPLDTCTGKWVSAAPDTSGEFTAVGYYFAKEIQRELHRPVGLISAYYGGSGIEAWLSPDAVDALPGIKAAAEPITEEAKSYPQRLQDYRTQYHAWQAKHHREDVPDPKRNTYANPNTDISSWHPVQIKGAFSDASLVNGGVLWLRRTVIIPPEIAGTYLPLHLGTLREFDKVFWDGLPVGSTTADATGMSNDQTHSTTDRRYDVPGNLVKAGTSVLTLRIFNPVGSPAIERLPESGNPALSGAWLAKTESAQEPLSDAAKPEFPHRPALPVPERLLPSSLYNAMIHPLIPYAMRGVIWFQGEANVGRAFQYRTIFPAMIEDWRRNWGQGNFPFYLCQLANFGAKDTQPHESALAELREAQSMALRLPQTGQALTIDVGEEADIHFKDKKTVGLRLSRIALAKTYGKHLIYSGPVYASSERDGAGMRIHFHFAEGGLKASAIPATYKRKSTLTESIPLVRNSPASELEGFQICGADHQWKWADAKIVGDAVVVSSQQVPDPVAVRYAWGNNPTVNFYNAAGLPAAPFRTDDFPSLTRYAHF